MDKIRTGGCQCGAVRFRATALRDNPHVCHCRMCQKASGNFFAALVGVLHEHLTWTRGQAAEFASSSVAFRGFCRDCGTPLYYRTAGGQHVSISIGAFDDPASIPLEFEFAFDRRLPQIDQLMGAIERYPLAEMGKSLEAIAESNHQHPDHDTDHWP